MNTEGFRHFPKLQTVTAIVNATVIPMDSERLLPHHSVIIDRGVITAMGPDSEFDLSGYTIIDANGRYLMPGLADMHAHLSDPTESAMFLANGVTFVRNMWGHPWHLALKRMVERAEWPGPHVATTSPLVDGLGDDNLTVWPDSILLSDRADARALVAGFKERGYEQIKVYSWLSLELLEAIGQACAEFQLPLTGHCPATISFEEAMLAGMYCFEHLSGIGHGHLLNGAVMPRLRDHNTRGFGNPNELMLLGTALDFDSIKRLGAHLAERGTWNCPTLVLWQQATRAVGGLTEDSLMDYESPWEAAMWNPAEDFRFKNSGLPRAELHLMSAARDEALLKVLSTFRQEGAPLLVGTDTSNPLVFQGFSIHSELDNFVQAGFTPYEALRCATAEAARYIGQSDIWGTIAPGRRADLVLTSSNPLADVKVLRDPDAVFVNGCHFSRSDLESLLAWRMNAVAASPTPLSRMDIVPEGQLVADGLLTEYTAGWETGFLSYRHCRLPDGRWLIDEQRTSRTDYATYRTRLWLSPSGTIDELVARKSTFFGEDVYRVTPSSSNSYIVRAKEVDGWESVRETHRQVLRPSERTCITSFPITMGSVAPDSAVSMLSIDRGKANPVCEDSAIGCEASKSTSTSGVSHLVRITRPGEVREVRFDLDQGGRLLKLEGDSTTYAAASALPGANHDRYVF